MTDHVTFGEAQLTIEQVVALSQRSARAQLQGDTAYREKIAKGALVTGKPDLRVGAFDRVERRWR